MAGEIAKAYVQVIPSAEGITGNLSKIFGSTMPGAGKSAGGLFSGGLISTIKTAIAAAGVGTFLKESLTAGAALQQSLGGIETLFKDSAAIVIANAQQAYSTAGLSANAYMEAVTGFSASLLQSLGGDTAAAADVANMALIDMSDNANKMGTSMASIQDAYQGFAKQNYTMLDNLKLGYGGTKTEMERLLKDAQKLTGVKYDINNLADVYSAIHVIQEDLGIMGATAAEASTTLTGSFNAMKAAAADVLGNLALGKDLGPSLNALAQTTVTFLKGNLLPAIGNIVTALPGAVVTFINALLPGDMNSIVTTALQNFSAFMTAGLPQILSNGEQLISQLVLGFQTGSPGFLSTVTGVLGQVLTTIIAALPSVLQSGVNIITQIVSGFLSGVPNFLMAAGNLLNQLLTALLAAVPSMLSSGISLISNLASGLLASAPNVISSATVVVTNLLSTLGSHLPELLAQGISMIGQLVAGLISKIPDVISSAKDIGKQMLDTVKEVDWLGLGKDIVNGIVSGLINGATALYNAVRNIIQNALSAGKEEAEVNSPSRLFRRELGYWIPSGAALGVLDGIPLIDNAMGKMHDALTAPFTSSLRIGAGDFSVTGYGSGSGHGRVVNLVQHIHSEAKSAADLMREARYQQELAVMMGV